MDIKARLDKFITEAGTAFILEVDGESYLRVVVQNADTLNTIQVRARLKGQGTEGTLLKEISGNDDVKISIATYEEVIVYCTNLQANPLADVPVVRVIASSFNLASGSAISIDVPAGSNISDIETLTFTSSDNSVYIEGNDFSKSIDFTVNIGELDQIEEYDSLSNFPVVGSANVIYIAKDTEKLYRWSGSIYVEVSPSPVQSVNGQTGIVTLTKSNIGLSNVDNTSDINKPISNAAQTEFNLIDGRLDSLEEINSIKKFHAFQDNAQVYADGIPGVKDPSTNIYSNGLIRDGWYFKNSVSGQKINWYFFDGTTQGTITLGNFSAYAVMTFDAITAYPILAVYTFPTGSGDIFPGFAHSRVVYSNPLIPAATAGIKYLVYFGDEPAAHPELPRINLTYNTISSGGDQNPAEIVLTSSFGSNSSDPINQVQFLVETLGVNSPSIKQEMDLRIKLATQSDFSSHVTNFSNPHSVTKSQVGLANVDNTSDLNKPISTATQTALNAKQDSLGFTPENVSNKSTNTSLGTSNTLYPSQNAVKVYVDNLVSAGAPDATSTTKGILKLTGDLGGTADSPTVPGLSSKQNTLISGTNIKSINGNSILGSGDLIIAGGVSSVNSQTGDVIITQADIGLSNVNNTSDANKPISTATQTALNLKYDSSNPAGYITLAQVPADAVTSVNGLTGAVTIPTGNPISVKDEGTQITGSAASFNFTGAGVATSSDLSGNVTVSVSSAGDATTLIVEAYNDTGATIPKMSVVYINGSQGNLPKLALSLGDAEPTSSKTLGIVRSDISNMNNGFVVATGRLQDLNTNIVGWNEGDSLWLSPSVAGAITNVKPTAPNHAVFIGTLIRKHPTQGVIEVKIQNGFELQELHNVAINGISDGQVIKYEYATSLWKNVTLTKSDVGLSNVDNTSDANKPISTATAIALSGKQDSLGFTAENVSNKSTNTSLGTSDTLYPSQNAVKVYVDNATASVSYVDTIVPSLNIDWSSGTTFYKDISASSTFTFSNIIPGKTITLVVYNSSAIAVNVTLPTIKIEANALDTAVSATTANVYVFVSINGSVYASSISGVS